MNDTLALPRVLIADDHDLAREGLRALLERSGAFTVVAEARSGEEALARAAEQPLDLALLDIRYSGGGVDGLEVARRLAEAAPAIGVVLITMHDSADYVFPPALMRRAVTEDRASPVLAAIKRLTPREREVLAALATGSTNKEIALALGITPGTVKTHVERLIGKLGVRDRTQAAILAVEFGIGRAA